MSLKAGTTGTAHTPPDSDTTGRRVRQARLRVRARPRRKRVRDRVGGHGGWREGKAEGSGQTREATAWVLPTPEPGKRKRWSAKVRLGLEIRASQPQSPAGGRRDQRTALY